MSILTGLLLAALACVVGFFIGRQSAPGKQEAGELKNQLAAADKALHDYRHDVNQHFQQTAHLIGRLTENHRQLYQHLAIGAHELTQDGQAARLYRPEQLGLQSREEPQATAPMPAEAAMDSELHETYAQPSAATAPRDYVPQSHGIMGSATPQPERA
ncbi:MAG: DUF1043 family protein [Gammaproteobacteria bacterium]|nr:DUF1043 family protein [Gammaproteobacteria bacterium]